MPDQLAAGEQDRTSLGARLRHAWAVLSGRAPVPAGKDSAEALLAESVREMPIALLVTDAAQRICYANPAFEALSGRRPAELLGAHPGRLLQGPATSPEARARVHAALDRGEPVTEELLNFRPDGTPYWIDLHVVPVRGGDGRVAHYVGVQLNATARIEAAAAFESAAVRWRDLAASLPLGIFELSPDGTVLYANTRFATLTGCGSAETIGSDWCVAVHQEDRRRVHALWERAREAGKVMDTVLRSQTPAGVRWLQAMVTPIRAEGGALTGWFGSLQDITARMETEATLRAFFTEAQEARTLAERRATEAAELVKELDAARNAALESVRLKSEFLANMSHEIRTPMNAIVGFSELLLDMPLGDVERDFAQTVRGAARNLLGLINDILDFSKIEAGQLTMEIAPFDLRHELDEIADLLAPRAHEKGVDLAVEVAADVPQEFAADVQRVRQVLLNLAGNAVKFTERGHVRLVARMVPWPADGAPALRIDVEDTGIGIPDDKIEFIFGKFTQADGSTNRKFGGTGLGLAISRQLAQMMGGDVTASSALGVGSTFSFEAPLPVVSLAAAPDGAPVRVLLVDASSATGPATARTLTAMGAEVLHVPAVPQAMAALADLARSGGSFDLVVADARLVGLDLGAVAEAARAGGATPLFAAVSEPSALRVLDAAAGLGWTDRLLRPIKRRDLAALLERARAGVEARPATGQPHRAEQARFGDVRILVAEDNADNRRFATVVLEQFGCRVLVAEHGEEAVARWSSEAPDLILMDCMMPGLDGFEATRAIRSREGDGHRTPIVALTANAMAGDRERCLAAGMDDYLSKPFKRADLAAVLSRWLPEGAIRT